MVWGNSGFGASTIDGGGNHGSSSNWGSGGWGGGGWGSSHREERHEPAGVHHSQCIACNPSSWGNSGPISTHHDVTCSGCERDRSALSIGGGGFGSSTAKLVAGAIVIGSLYSSGKSKNGNKSPSFFSSSSMDSKSSDKKYESEQRFTDCNNNSVDVCDAGCYTENTERLRSLPKGYEKKMKSSEEKKSKKDKKEKKNKKARDAYVPSYRSLWADSPPSVWRN